MADYTGVMRLANQENTENMQKSLHDYQVVLKGLDISELQSYDNERFLGMIKQADLLIAGAFGVSRDLLDV